MRSVGLGVGLIATVLLPIALYLFGTLRFDQTVSAIFLLSGLWTLVFGVSMAARDERLYYSGTGVVVGILSSFIFIPIAFTAGLEIVAIVVLALFAALSKQR